MICSTRSTKPGSNWLDRLRSNKGIPTGDDLDLDSFLLNLKTHSPQTRPIKPAHHRPTEAHDHDPPLSAVLAELFNPGSTVTVTTKKCPRKQTNPKIFIESSSSAAINGNAPAIDAGDAVVEVEDRGEEEKECEEDLKGFTRSEVTVIDTSCSVWKVDKFVFRKNNVWKIRERKSKSKFLAKKKSKATHEFDVHGIGTSKDNVVNIGGEKPLKKQKAI